MQIPELNPQPVQLKFLTATQNIVFFGGGAGGGKSWSLLVDNLQGVHDPDYFSVFFRTTTTEIDKALWPAAKKMYEPYLKDGSGRFIGQAAIHEKTKTITFPSGARTTFTYLESDKNADSWYGSEIAKIYFDEFQFRSEYQFDILRSRNRSVAKVVKGIRCTLNPDPDHFVYDWVLPFLDEEGFPIKEYSGKTRYFLIVDGQLHTSWDEEELKIKYKKNPQTYTYIPSTLEDNEVLKLIDPGYKDVLDSMPERKRKQLLLGCWLKDQDSGLFFRRAWLKPVTHVPMKCITVRSYDLGYSEPHPNNKYPDYTASVKISKDRDGFYYLWGDYQEDAHDEGSAVVGRYRKSPGERDILMLKQARMDTADVKIILPREPASGKENFQSKVKKFCVEGFTVAQDPMPHTVPKLKRFEALSSAAEAGLVKILPHTFSKATLEAFLTELEGFDGVTKSGPRRKDDWVDAAATGFNYLNSKRVHHTVVRNQIQSSTLSKDVLQTYRR